MGNGSETLMWLKVFAEDPIGHAPEEVLRADAARLVRSLMEMVDRNEKSDTNEHRITVNGMQRAFEVSGAAKRQNGRPAGYVFECRDVTERMVRSLTRCPRRPNWSGRSGGKANTCLTITPILTQPLETGVSQLRSRPMHF